MVKPTSLPISIVVSISLEVEFNEVVGFDLDFDFYLQEIKTEKLIVKKSINSRPTTLDSTVINYLSWFLGENNEYVRTFKTAKQIAEGMDLESYGVRLFNDIQDRRYDLPLPGSVYGNPQHFITFTCNVKWPEITQYMDTHHQTDMHSRADIIGRVFNIKVREFIRFLKEDKTFGDVEACVILE
ncbi:unnamed protein product [Lactuca saligna]|uniref:Helitron helicase-like domain-containing protein n=1 Tax=Lactuca saligna TaxID=75948 RepID=A0AA35UNP8_LACSI|nr:unnamed protein product [Lactuca saligna]